MDSPLDIAGLARESYAFSQVVFYSYARGILIGCQEEPHDMGGHILSCCCSVIFLSDLTRTSTVSVTCFRRLETCFRTNRSGFI